ncbi:hypothetical protein R8Z50_14155 [Longispora sp. K20-0274]|uniref:hypothetical protein n=1 Tax=Longispora sp. K20-0274 TaxID=3088255 RepID=UPI00399A3370
MGGGGDAPAGARELGSRRRAQPAPPAVVWSALARPRAPGARPWLELLPDEVEPLVVRSVEPVLVVWSSLWPDRPQEEIHFELAPDGSGTMLRWVLLSADVPPTDSLLGHMRHRLNVLVNERLRLSFGQ